MRAGTLSNACTCAVGIGLVPLWCRRMGVLKNLAGINTPEADLSDIPRQHPEIDLAPPSIASLQLDRYAWFGPGDDAAVGRRRKATLFLLQGATMPVRRPDNSAPYIQPLVPSQPRTLRQLPYCW